MTRRQHDDHAAAMAARTIGANVTITDVPFGRGEIHAHLHTDPGTIGVEPGHLDSADLTITLDYDTATAILAAPRSAVRAFMLGTVKVTFRPTRTIAAEAPCVARTAIAGVPTPSERRVPARSTRDHWTTEEHQCPATFPNVLSSAG